MATDEMQAETVTMLKKKRKCTPPVPPVMAEKTRDALVVVAVPEEEKKKVTGAGVLVLDEEDAQQILWPILRGMREANKNYERRLHDMYVLIITKADKSEVKEYMGRLNQVNVDIATHATRTEQLFQDSRQFRTDLDNLSRSFDDYNSTRRHTLRWSTVAPQPSFHCLPEIKRSQGCTGFATAISTNYSCNCPPGTPNEPSSDLTLSSSLLKLQNIRFDNIEGELENFRKKLDKIQSFIDEQILNLSEKQISLERDIEEVIRLFKERRRPTLKVATLDMNVVEKMLDDYEQIVEEMKTYDEFGKQLDQKTDRLFYLCDDLKRNKADSRTVKDAMDTKADSEDLRGKVSRSVIDEFVRSQNLQMESLVKQTQCSDSLIKSELGKFLETLSTRASQDMVEELRSFVQELAEQVKISNAVIALKKHAAATSCNVRCLSCGDEVVMEPRNDIPYNHPCLPAREIISPFTAYGKNRDHPNTARCPPRRPRSCSVSPRSPRTYTSLIDARNNEVWRYRESLRAALPAGRYCGTKANIPGRAPVMSLPQSHIAQKIVELSQRSTVKKKGSVIPPKKGRGKR